jgi:hypothetical protein
LVSVEPRDREPLAWWRAELRRRMVRVLADRKLTVEELLAPPVREGNHVTQYCPACLAQYEQGAGTGGHCPNDVCHDIPLRPFASDKPVAPSSEGSS